MPGSTNWKLTCLLQRIGLDDSQIRTVVELAEARTATLQQVCERLRLNIRSRLPCGAQKAGIKLRCNLMYQHMGEPHQAIDGGITTWSDSECDREAANVFDLEVAKIMYPANG